MSEKIRFEVYVEIFKKLPPASLKNLFDVSNEALKKLDEKNKEFDDIKIVKEAAEMAITMQLNL